MVTSITSWPGSSDLGVEYQCRGERHSASVIFSEEEQRTQSANTIRVYSYACKITYPMDAAQVEHQLTLATEVILARLTPTVTRADIIRTITRAITIATVSTDMNDSVLTRAGYRMRSLTGSRMTGERPVLICRHRAQHAYTCWENPYRRLSHRPASNKGFYQFDVQEETSAPN
jgi:hypothetical protein